MHPNEKQLFVVNGVLGYCQVLDPESLEVQDTFPVGQRPRAMALSSDGRYLYIAEESIPVLHVIDTSNYQQVDTVGVVEPRAYTRSAELRARDRGTAEGLWEPLIESIGALFP